MSLLSPEIIGKNKLKEYFNSKMHPCYAPHVSLNFDSSGIVTACCYNRSHVLGRYPENTLLEIWSGEKLAELRNALDRYDFSKGCHLCYKRIAEGNIANSQIIMYDEMANGRGVLPVMLELEISTICNYECIMCGGKWSSSIRKNREKLPPLSTPYDEKFVDGLRPFMRSLRFVRILGGEPFASPVYYSLLDALYESNPDVRISVTTNGSIFSKRVQDILERNQNINICISLDSLSDETYAYIRKNGNLKTVLSNIKKIQEIESKKQKRIFDSLAFCPMIQNWREIPEIIRFCEHNGLYLKFNHVANPLGGRLQGIHDTTLPVTKYIFDGVEKREVSVELDKKIPEVSLFTLPDEQRAEIVTFLNSVQRECNDSYKSVVAGLISSINNI